VPASAQQPPQPAFKSSVEVTSLDVTVVDTNGKPITNLTPADFVVRIDNNVRRVVTAEWVQLTSGDEKPMYRTELRSLQSSITAAMAKTADHETKAHLEASRDEISKILDPKFLPPAPAAGQGGGGRGGAR